jgi:hypothetical protein
MRITMALLVLLAAGAAGAAAASGQVPSPARGQDDPVVADFSKLVRDYVELHRKAEATLPARPDRPTSEQLDTHERALSRLIARARPKAPAGSVFTREIRAYLRRQIARALSGPDGAQIRRSIMDENPGRFNIPINSRYPDHVPLSTMPTQILAALPKLPDELEYRFIGDRLILLDVHAHLIVDYMDTALPK